METKEFFDKRAEQKLEDTKNNTRERSGRHISNISQDLIFLFRAIGMLRGLTAELEVSCPTFQILALHARVGILKK